MKKHYIYNKVGTAGLAAMIMSLFLTACSLDQTPYSEVTNEDFVKDAPSMNTLLMGCYNGLHNVMEYEWAVTELRSDNARMYGNNSTSNTTKLVEQLDQSTIGAEHDWVTSYWNGCYATIARVNNVLAHLDVVGDETLRNQYEGEALFLRSLEYFNLVRLWGPVFIVTSKTPSDVARNMQRSTVEEVYALIEGDLEKVVYEGLLPESFDGTNLGRADLTAAKALLAKVYATHYKLGDDEYAEAATLCREVLQSSRVGNPRSGDDLVPFADIFDIDKEMNNEIIFAVRYLSGNVGLGSPFGNMFAPINNGANVIIGTSNNYNTPSDNIITTYINEGDNIRFDVNIAQRYYNATTDTWVEATYCKKYTNPVTTQFDGERPRCVNSPRIPVAMYRLPLPTNCRWCVNVLESTRTPLPTSLTSTTSVRRYARSVVWNWRLKTKDGSTCCAGVMLQRQSITISLRRLSIVHTPIL